MHDKTKSARSHLDALGLRPKKNFSQNFLTSSHVVNDIVSALDLSPGAMVIELGPGLGKLTRALIEAALSVIAIERDRDMIAALAEEFGAHPRLTVREADAADIDYSKLRDETERPLNIAGNLPYAITGRILRNLVDQAEHVRQAVIMIQKEVGERLVAKPNAEAYGALTIFVQSAYSVTRIRHVGRAHFYPAPKVDSVVVRLERLAQAPTLPAMFGQVVKAAFAKRRKTLRNALSAVAKTTGIEVSDALANAGIDGQRRGETLSIDEFRALASHFEH